MSFVRPVAGAKALEGWKRAKAKTRLVPLSAGGPLCWPGLAGGSGWSVIGGIHVRIAIDYLSLSHPGRGRAATSCSSSAAWVCECSSWTGTAGVAEEV